MAKKRKAKAKTKAKAKAKAKAKGPVVVKLHTTKKVVPVLMPTSAMQALMADPVIRKVEVVAPLEETGWQKFIRLFFTDDPAPGKGRGPK
jgi:hypothetical protein